MIGVKYNQRSDFEFLVSTLPLIYHVKAHPVSTKFLGFTITSNHNRSLKTLSVSYLGYVSTLLARLRPNGVRPTSSPFLYTPPSYGSRPPQSPTGPDFSPPASPTQIKELQAAVGYLLHLDPP
jgi:hypothetical protein